MGYLFWLGIGCLLLIGGYIFYYKSKVVGIDLIFIGIFYLTIIITVLVVAPFAIRVKLIGFNRVETEVQLLKTSKTPVISGIALIPEIVKWNQWLAREKYFANHTLLSPFTSSEIKNVNYIEWINN